MTDLIDVVQKQDPGSELVELIEIELSDTTTLYFHAGLEANLTTVQFRDKLPTDSVYIPRTYVAIPIELRGIERKADGAAARPRLSIANILTTFRGAIEPLTNKELVGKRVARRTTLKKYLVGESPDLSSPPIEFPTEKFVIDRIGSETKVSITFELTPVTDLQGVVLPNRLVVGKYCNWEYQGARYPNYRGGCTWKANSEISRTVAGTTTVHKAYFTIDNEPILPTAQTSNFSTWGSSADKDDLIKRDEDIGDTSNVTVYWRANADVSVAPTVTSENTDWTRVRIYDDYASGTPYTYNIDNYQYVKNTDTIWRLTRTGTGKTPEAGSQYWIRGDLCGKILSSCKCRFQWQPQSGSTVVPKVDKNTDIPLPFGGFPGSEKYR